MESPKSEPKAAGIVLFAINYPYFIIVACLITAIMGVLLAVSLPKDLLPPSHQPAVQILSFYPGMPVENVAMDLTERFERYTGQSVGIQKQESRSLSGVSIVKNFFDPAMDLNSAISQTSAMVMSVLRKLPPGTQPPLILPFDPTASVPLALIAVSGDFPEKRLVDVGRYDVGDSVQAVPGAMAPTVMGGAERRAIVYLNEKRLKQFNFSPVQVLSHMTSLNTFIPTGDIKIDHLDYQILSNGLADKVEDMNLYPLRSQNGVTVRLRDVGEAKDDHAIQTNVVMIDGKPQVYVPVYRQPGANSIEVVDRIREAMKDLQERLGGINLTVVADQTDFIRHAIHSIVEETLIGGGLAALLVLLFLGNPRATGGIVLSIPLSILFAFIGFKVVGQTLNAMTLGGLALSIGVLVDNAIVVLENIAKKREVGLGRLQAAIEGASEVAMPVLASTLPTLVVLFPIVFLGGVTKILFSALALSVVFTMVASYFVAMTVIPLYASYVMPEHATHAHELWAPLRFCQYWLDRLNQAYASALVRVLKNRGKLFLGVLCLIIAAVLTVPMIGSELFPRADAGNFVFKVRLASGTRIEESEQFAKEMNDKLRQWIDPKDLKMIISNVGLLYGYSAAFTPNSGTQDMFFLIELTAERRHTTQYYAKIIRDHMKNEFPNYDIGMELGGLMTSALNGGLQSPIDLQIEGPSMEDAHKIAEQLLPQIKKLPGAVDVRIQQRLDMPELFLNVDRVKAADLGLTVDDIMKSVVSTVSGSFSFNPAIWVDPHSGIDYFFGVQMPTDQIESIDALKNIPLTGKSQDRSVLLGRVAEIKQVTGASETNNVNLQPVIDIFLDAQDRDIGGLSSDVQKILDQTKLPPTYHAYIRGEFKEMNNAVRDLKGGFLLAAVLVYLILVVQFKSFKIPGIIMITVPMGAIGIIFMLAATHTYFSIQAAIGAIFMIGVAVAHGVLLIEFIQHKVHELPVLTSESMFGAVIEAARARLRPILMTALASIFGSIPMAVGLGHGSEANIPLGRAVIGGQLLSTFLPLFLIPALYLVFMRVPKKSEGEAP
jgi:multidrug efflux pump subunit AcrB